MIFIYILILAIILYCLWKNYKLIQYWKQYKIESQSNLQQAKQIKLQKQNQQQKLNKEIQDLQKKKSEIILSIKQQQDLAVSIKQQQQKNIDQEIQLYKNNVRENFSKYKNALDDAARLAEIQHNQKVEKLQLDLQQITKELDKMKMTRDAAREAILRQQEIKQNLDQYCLKPAPADQDDIDRLQTIKKDLHKPRILSMLIWQTYWQPLAKTQFPIILGSSTPKTGIYKITNIVTQECYIGQAVDIDKRWKQHCKMGLGIDTPPGNKLYKAISEYGLQNFSFEVLEECEKQNLNQAQKFYINLYDSCNFGYNSNKGIDK